MKEDVVVRLIENWLSYKNRYYTNNHGSLFSKNGVPDFTTIDKNGQFVDIEAKRPGKVPVVNQWRHLIQICKSGGRAIVGYDDFTIDKMDEHSFPILEIDEQPLIEFELAETIRLNGTTEIHLRTKGD